VAPPAMTIEDLQRVVESSVQNASALSQQLFRDHWDAEQIQAFINQTRNITIATVSRDGRPHAASVIGGCLDGVIHFSASLRSALLSNLRRTPWVAFTVVDADHIVMGRGEAALAGRSLEVPDLLERLGAASDQGRFTPDGWDGMIYSINAERVFAS
jgi:hypothetical protein